MASGEVARERVRKYVLPYALSIGQSKIFHGESAKYGAISGAIAVCGAITGASAHACANGRGHVSYGRDSATVSLQVVHSGTEKQREEGDSVLPIRATLESNAAGHQTNRWHDWFICTSGQARAAA